MTIPQLYQGGEQAIASYNYTDLIDGTGYVRYYGASDGTNFYLTPKSLYSTLAATPTLAHGSTAIFNKNFDVVFAAPQYMQGILLANVPVVCDNLGAGTKTYAVAVTVNHYDGSTTTQLGTATVNSQTTTGSTVTYAEHQIVLVPVSLTAKAFKVGHTLRINVTVTATVSSGTANSSVGHDPAGRISLNGSGNAFTVSSAMTFDIPFRTFR